MTLPALIATDVDGTLLEMAATPDAVQVEANLQDLLDAYRAILQPGLPR